METALRGISASTPFASAGAEAPASAIGNHAGKRAPAASPERPSPSLRVLAVAEATVVALGFEMRSPWSRAAILRGAVVASALLALTPSALAASPTDRRPPTAGVAADTLHLSLHDCVSSALKFGEEIRQAEATRANAHAQYIQARSTVLPQIRLTGTYTKQLESIFQTGEELEEFDPDTLAPIEDRVRELEDALPTSGFLAIQQLLSSSAFASENSWNAALNLSQKVFSGSVASSIRTARHALKATEHALNDTKSEVTWKARSAYLDALLAVRGAQIAQLALDQADTQLRRVRLRQEAGQTSQFELLAAEVQRDNQVPALRQALSVREMAELELRRLCNLPQGVPLALTTPLLDAQAVPAEPALIDTAGINRSALDAAGVKALEEALDARDHAVGIARSGYFPDISLFANISQQAYPADPMPKRSDWRRDESIGVMASWALFDGLFTRGAVEQAKANRLAALQDLNQVRELVRLAVRQGIWELDLAAADLTARSRTVQLARRALDLAGLRYEEGASGALEVTDARIAWQMAQINESQAQRDYFVALALLERYTGRPYFSDAIPDIDFEDVDAPR